MKLRVLLTCTAFGLGVAALVSETAGASPSVFGTFDKDAKKAPGKPAAPAVKKPAPNGAKDKGDAAVDGPATLPKQIGLAPKGLKWGMTLEEVAKLYEKEIDKDCAKLFKGVNPGGPRYVAIENDCADRKVLLKRNEVEFGNVPTGVDQTPLKPEYSYANGESMSKITLSTGTTRNFFFIQKKLWKVYDEYKLRKGGPLGETFKDTIAILTKKLGVPPRLQPQDYDKGRDYDTADWADNATLIRVLDRGNVAAVVYVELATENNLPNLRTAKPEEPNTIDPAVLGATAAPKPPPDPSGKGAPPKKKKK